jgi:hypothetical protein
MPLPTAEPFSRAHAASLAAIGAAALAVALEFDHLYRAAPDRMERRRDFWQVRFRGFSIWRPRVARVYERAARRVVDGFFVFLGVATLGSSVLVIRPPRTGKPRPWTNWGTAAVAVIALVGTLLVAKDLLWLGLTYPPPFLPVGILLNDVHRSAGLALGAFVTFALLGKRKPPGNWRDRLALRIGWSWMSYFVYLIAWPILWG